MPSAQGEPHDSQRRVLVVEDEWLIANELEQDLNEAGFSIVGPVGSVERALAAIEAGRIDAAVLDVRLQSEDSYAVAERLQERQIPFLFITGYSSGEIADPYRRHACLQKPFSSRGLLEAVAGILER
jgi:DNA-binding NtrC family response regulator